MTGSFKFQLSCMYEEEYAAFIRVKILKMTGKRGGTEPLTFGDLTIIKTGFVHRLNSG